MFKNLKKKQKQKKRTSTLKKQHFLAVVIHFLVDAIFHFKKKSYYGAKYELSCENQKRQPAKNKKKEIAPNANLIPVCLSVCYKFSRY
jgi:hypothetical protein